MTLQITEPLSPGRKAWLTRLANGYAPKRAAPAPSAPDRTVMALAAFDQQAASDSPDWHAAALALRAALQAAIVARAPTSRRTLARPLPGRPTALPAPVLADYPIRGVKTLAWPGPIAACTFADGETVRMSFATTKGKPICAARGIRLAITAYRFRKAGRMAALRDQAARANAVEVPAFTSCAIVSRDGDTLAAPSLELVNSTSAPWRAPQSEGAPG